MQTSIIVQIVHWIDYAGFLTSILILLRKKTFSAVLKVKLPSTNYFSSKIRYYKNTLFLTFCVPFNFQIRRWEWRLDATFASVFIRNVSQTLCLVKAFKHISKADQQRRTWGAGGQPTEHQPAVFSYGTKGSQQHSGLY